MITLQLSNKSAREIYPKADSALKQVLEGSAPAGFFSLDITERVKSYEDACEEKGIDPVKSLPFSGATDTLSVWMNSVFMLAVICEVLNEGWFPDYTDADQEKWYPIGRKDGPSGFRFGDSGCDNTLTYVGSRLCLKNKKLSDYLFSQFTELIEIIHTK